ncbi:MAG: hypothetical protein LKH26_05390 [Lactobacillus sp.]|nr:hypothetical protein [Lactobacillus sp.]MCI1482075.1 hypothetical protein [Lactobacillus sp.]
MTTTDQELLKQIIRLSLNQTNAIALVSEQIFELAKQKKGVLPNTEQLLTTFQQNQQLQQEIIAEWNKTHPDNQLQVHFNGKS